MRALLVVVAVLMAGCSPRPCAETCNGCCDGFDECFAGTTDAHCGITGGKFCTVCTGAVSCSPTGFCAPRVTTGGGGGATGGGAGGGGGVVEESVFVTLRFDRPIDHNDGTCRVQTVATCVGTKSVLLSRFQELRTTAYSSCTVAQTSSDGYDADCTGKCTLTRPSCVRANGIPRNGGDDVYNCARIAGTSDPCEWTP